MECLIIQLTVLIMFLSSRGAVRPEADFYYVDMNEKTG